MGTLLKQLHMMWVSMCVALWEVWGHNTVEGGQQSSKETKFARKKIPKMFFLLTGTKCMGYEYVFQFCSE